MSSFYEKYMLYKHKYLTLKKQQGGESFTLTVQEPWFTLIQKGIKTVEGRLNRGIFSKLKKGDIVTWLNKKSNKTVKVRIMEIKKYTSFETMIEKEGIEKILPNQGFKTVDEAVKVYRQWYSVKDERVGVLGIHMQVV